MAQTQSCRIIGGQWRGRKIAFPAASDVRPTPDRVRETLFNWLMQSIAGARCFDPFAGSGALGFEALSRGASELVMIESDKSVYRMLEKSIETLDCSARTHLIQGRSPEIWDRVTGRFDIIFLDPPFKARMVPPLLSTLFSRGLADAQTLIYTESEEPPETWDVSGLNLRKSKKAGAVYYALLDIDHPS